MLYSEFPVATMLNKHTLKKNEKRNQLFGTSVTVDWTDMSVGCNENNLSIMNSDGHGQSRWMKMITRGTSSRNSGGHTVWNKSRSLK